jgi:hypothetical protein
LFLDPGMKTPIASIAQALRSCKYGLATLEDPLRMERTKFEPFGEFLDQHEDGSPRTRASRWLLWTGAAIFWSTVGFVVIARAVFFDPAVFSDFSRLAALAQSIF